MLKIDLSTFLAQYAPPNDHAINAYFHNTEKTIFSILSNQYPFVVS